MVNEVLQRLRVQLVIELPAVQLTILHQCITMCKDIIRHGTPRNDPDRDDLQYIGKCELELAACQIYMRHVKRGTLDMLDEEIETQMIEDSEPH